MMYVLNHRLDSQRIPKSKGIKVNNDIVSIMLHERFLNQLFKPQTIYNRQALRKLFEDLAHASIMRLDPESMNKLYDLMIMAFKYQTLLARQPSELLLITLNHLDAIRSYVTRPDIVKQIDAAYSTIMKVYGHLTFGELQSIRYSLLNILSGFHVRVSVFLRDNSQNSDGSFIIPTSGPIPRDCEIPGIIRMFHTDGAISMVKNFPAEGPYESPLSPGSLEAFGDRGTKLGCNIYLHHHNDEVACPVHHINNEELLPNSTSERNMTEGENESVHLGKEELNILMSQLLGKRAENLSKVSGRDMIQLNICSISTEENVSAKQYELALNSMLHIDARNHSSCSALQKVFGEMTIEDKNHTNNENKELIDLFDGLSEK